MTEGENPGVKVGNNIVLSEGTANNVIDTVAKLLTQGTSLEGKIPPFQKGSGQGRNT